MSTPRSVANRKPVRLIPASTRPRPSVCARSAKIGPADVDVRTGTPASNRNDSPPLVEPIGIPAMLMPSASVMKEMRAPFSALEEGMKWRPCAWSDAGLFGSPDPARKSGCCPGPKMKRSEMRSRRCCALAGDVAKSDATQPRTISLLILPSRNARVSIVGWKEAISVARSAIS